MSTVPSALGERLLIPASPAESLSAFYIYTSQMSFLIRLASTREGAEKLLDAELFARLSQCEYLGARPEDEPTSMGERPFSTCAGTILILGDLGRL